MKNLTADNITEAVQRTFENSPDERLREVMSALTAHLHDFAREVNLTRDEWLAAHDFLMRAGEISDDRRSEFMLTSDILGMSSLMDFLDQSNTEASEASLLGPFYKPNAPMLEVGGDLKGDNDGDPLWFEGRILSEDGEPIEGVLLETWQTAANGLYDLQDPDQPDVNFRCRMRTGPDGRYAFRTIKPIPYTVPHDGPVGDLLKAIKKHPWRPAHTHFRLSAAGYRTLVTELFDEDDSYIEEDCVFGVRETLVLRYEPDGEGGYRVSYDFRLQRT